ncbi:Ribonuclease H-like domain,Transposase, IS4-like,Transposase, Tn5-like, core,CAAX amino terminal [Cinara cedri]|uniref:Ribonuclease H-like domain,Transposase, IS4-like,Transposase, Tn5-like, core,CAAX amino terminal n=1 Tax=Cinara cedri TaxID=506608 RepID=A0A5E4NN51_9HEMI|nr:Ribonuclease H-like domain,Transposase, IS4-like,Transposase, Tn5-like, core,CAAX amino terminal [Cinara cedri]
MKYYIQETKWKQIFANLKSVKGIHSKNEDRIRRFMESVWYMARSGCQWRLLPEIYGNYRSVHKRFKKWCEKGIWEKLLKYTQDPDLEVQMIDGTIVRAHACAAGYKKDTGAQEALGRSKGGFTTKIHALVDALGNPLKFTLTAGQRNDITQAEALTENVSNSVVVADKGYDSNAFIVGLENKGCEVVIPPKRNRKVQRYYDEHIYKERHLIECFFGKIKHFRRIFSRFDKTATVTEPALTPEEMSDFNVNTPSFLLENFIILIITSLGKEIGWRGYLLTNLKDQIPNFYVRAIAVGLIVAIWHMPIFQVTGPLSWNDGLTFSIACTFTLFCCVESIVYTWLFEKDNSIWPVTIAHVTMHFMIQMIAMSFTIMSLSASTVITPMNDAISLTIAYLIVAIGIILFENTQGRSLSV